MLVEAKLLLRQNYVCRDKHVFVTTKMILVATPSNDTHLLSRNSSDLPTIHLRLALSLSLCTNPPPPTEGTTIRGCRSKSVPETRKVHSSQAHKSLLPPVLCPGSSNNGNNLFCVAFSPLVANRTPGNAVLLKNSRTSLASAACCLLCRRVCLRGYLFPRREKSVSLKTGGRGGGR